MKNKSPGLLNVCTHTLSVTAWRDCTHASNLALLNVCTYTLSVTAQDGETALILAASLGRTDVVVELVRGGANLDLQNKVC